ncbi:uncharacterized protein LOC108239314 [Kryptolebias marmoratus]|uniref:uncharacterized protein LOC108239314 n=1 Tax=Kryptolebias marmoratus TaxID=37003 RepID=UPI0018ACC479|nr:uncharacterized protein LOC108239314 [Kryptolebias marmoratus]
MTNGKRKMLAAETADLRKDWIGHLWQAMQLSSSGHFDAKVTEFEEYDQRERLNSDSVMEVAPARPLSTYSSSENIYAEAEDMTSPACPPEERHSEEDIYQNIQRPLNSRNPNDPIVTDPQSSEWSYRDKQENLYDVLPSRRSPCDARLPEMQDVVYDFPQSYRTSAEPQDCIYDVPSCIQRSYDHCQDEQNQEETYWKI